MAPILLTPRAIESKKNMKRWRDGIKGRTSSQPRPDLYERLIFQPMTCEFTKKFLNVGTHCAAAAGRCSWMVRRMLLAFLNGVFDTESEGREDEERIRTNRRSLTFVFFIQFCIVQAFLKPQIPA